MLAAIAASAGTAEAQRLIVATTTLTASREPVRVCVQSVDMAVGAPLPALEALSGQAPLSALLLLPGAGEAVLSSGTPWKGGEYGARYGWTQTSAYHVAPFSGAGQLQNTPGWLSAAACVMRDPASGEDIVVTLGTRMRGRGTRLGRLEAHRRTLEPKALFPHPPLAETFPGVPAGAVALGDSGRVAVLCQGPLGTGCTLHVLDIVTGGWVLQSVEVVDEESQFATSPSGIAVSGDGERLFVLTSGYAAGTSSGESSSWLHAFASADLEELRRPVEAPGMASVADTPLVPVGSDACWVATRTPSLGFAYATCVRVTPDGLDKEARIPLTRVTTPLRLSPNPDGTAVAAAFGKDLEVWPGNRRTGPAASYAAAINVVCWTREGLFVGEGGRVHQVDRATAESLRTVQLQTGAVTGMVLVPPELLPFPDPDADGLSSTDEILLGTSPGLADTDADGIPDGSDPEPTTPSPRLTLPSVAAFHEESMGNEVRVLSLRPAYGRDSSWRVEFDRERMPWLRIHPFAGGPDSLPEVIYMGIDSARYSRDTMPAGVLMVHVTGTQPDRSAAGSPATVALRVIPAARNDMRRILWIWDEGATSEPAIVPFRDPADPRGLRTLARMLAGPPHYFVHAEAAAPFLDALDRYAVVVLGATAASRGAVTRQALLEYVTWGGALLFLGEHLEGADSWALSEWLGPAGIHVDTSAKVEGTFPAAGRDGVCRYLENVRIEGGCAIYSDDASATLVPAGEGSEQAILLARTYGRGRIAVLASATPLESGSMDVQANRLFAAGLFHWLARAGMDPEDQDYDGDGLTDDTEDRNGNGEVEPGETDHFDPDSDGDGIPDGLEDVNLNGALDEGETNPLNPDSDSDGILDGADAVPLPRAGAPTVIAATPNEGPAEGGTPVVISGRNFSPGVTVWFGSRQAPNVKVLRSTDLFVEAPPCSVPAGGGVPLRVTGPAGVREGLLPGGFNYAPRSKVRLVLRAQAPVRKPNGLYEGTVSLHLVCSSKVYVDTLMVDLKAEPAEGFHWREFEGGDPPRRAMRGIVAQPTRSGHLQIVTLPAKRRHRLAGKIGEVKWVADTAAAGASSWRLCIEEARVLARNGQDLEVTLKDAVLEMGAPGKPGRAPVSDFPAS